MESDHAFASGRRLSAAAIGYATGTSDAHLITTFPVFKNALSSLVPHSYLADLLDQTNPSFVPSTKLRRPCSTHDMQYLLFPWMAATS